MMKNNKNNKLYELVIRYTEPTYQVLSILAESEEAAREKILKDYEEFRPPGSSDLEIKSVEEITKPQTIH